MEQVDIKSALDIANTIHKLFEDAKRELPYNINVIDELHANENAHSRILCKLLSYKDTEGRYRILESFVRYISQSVPSFDSIRICSPKITQEKERIDLWVRDSNYAIILENKVQGAVDQEHQLSRYIDVTKKCEQHYEDSQIYVVYLPADNHEPSDNSWGQYKADFEERYANLSFRDDIIPWLKKDVLPHCTIREDILISAIKQYIDYLEGLFRLRLSQQKYYHMETDWLAQIGIQGTTFAEQLDNIESIKKRLIEAQNILDDYRHEKIDAVMKNFTDLSLSLLGESWQYKDSISDEKRWYLLYDKQWNTSSCVHIEWSGVSIKDLFIQDGICKYRIVLHVEGVYRNNTQYTELLRKNLGDKYKREKNSTEFWRTTIESEKPIGAMTDSEMLSFFKKAYCTGEVAEVIEAINLTAQEYHALKNQPIKE